MTEIDLTISLDRPPGGLVLRVESRVTEPDADDPDEHEDSIELEKLQLDAVTILSKLMRSGRFGDRQGVQLLGRMLYRMLFAPGTDVRQHVEPLVTAAVAGRRELVIRLRIRNEELAGLPWELLCTDQRRFLATAKSPLLVRFSPRASGAPPAAPLRSDANGDGALRVMFAVVQPEEVLRDIVEAYDELLGSLRDEAVDDPRIDGAMQRSDMDGFLLARSWNQSLDPSMVRDHLHQVVNRAFEGDPEGDDVSRRQVPEDGEPGDDGVPRRQVPEDGEPENGYDGVPLLQVPEDGEPENGYDEDTFKQQLDETKPHVVHFIGLGRDKDQPEVAFCGVRRGRRGRTRASWVGPDLFAELIQDCTPRPSLMVLQLCQTTDDLFETNTRSFAEPLLNMGVLAVVAMQYPLHTNLAHEFVAGFYRDLRRGGTIEQAVQAGRAQTYRRTRYTSTPPYYRDFAAPALYSRVKNVALVEAPDPPQDRDPELTRSRADRPPPPRDPSRKTAGDEFTRSADQRFTPPHGPQIHG